MLASENISFLEVVVLQVEYKLYLKEGIEIVDERDSVLPSVVWECNVRRFSHFPGEEKHIYAAQHWTSSGRRSRGERASAVHETVRN